MALVLKDRVQETGTANTTVSFTLAGAVTGYQSFSVVGNTNTTYYAATDSSGNWESGLGTYSTTGPTLTRTTILASSNSGSAVTFSGGVTVFLTYPSSRALYLNDTSAGINVSQAAFTANGIPYASSTTALATGSALTFDGSFLATTVKAKATAFQFAGTTSVISNPSAGFGYNSTTTNVQAYSQGTSFVSFNGYGINIAPTDAAPIARLTIIGNGPIATSWVQAPTATNAFGIYYSGGTVSSGPFSAAGANAVSFRIANLDFGDETDSSSITDAATLYIEGAPTAGSIYTTIANSYALQVAAGTSYFGGSVTLNSGGALSGTFTGTPTFSGAVVLSGTPSISNGAALTGTFSGTPTFSGATTQSGGATFSNTTGNKLTVSGAVSRTAWTTTGPAINVAAGTYTSSAGLTGTVASSSFAQPTFAATTAAQTVTNGATLYIAAAPANGTNVTITNPYALYVAAGASYFGGAVTCNSNITLAAGTTSVAPIDFTAGSLLTSPVEGAMEFDGTAFYTTDDVTDGRGYLASIHYFRLAADVTAFGPAIGNFFGSTSGMNLDASVYYEVEAYLYFTKTTAGTVTFTMTFTQAPVNNDAHYVGTPVGGIGTVGTPQTAAIAKSTATAGALPATASLTTAVNHQYVLRSMFQANATTGGSINLQITSSAGTVTPLAGSYYKLTRLPAANTGAFA